MKTKFSSNLSRIRNSKGISQKKLAELTGLTRRMVAYYENECNNNLIKNINTMAKALDVNISDLIGVNNSKPDTTDNFKIDARTMDKIKKLLSLPKEERHSIYNMIDALIVKNKLDNKR